MNTPIYLGLAILDISKTVMYEFWYDYLKPKYEGNLKLCYMELCLGMIKDELCGKIMKEFVALGAKTYLYLDYHGKEEKRQKKQRSVLQKEKLNFLIIKHACLVTNLFCDLKQYLKTMYTH